VTKSNEKDPWLSSQTEDESGSEEAKAPEAENAPESPEADKKPEWLIATGDEEVELESSSEGSSNSASEQSDDEQPGSEFVPTEIPVKDPNAAAFTRQSEAKFIPSEPKIYRAPKSPEEEEDERSFGFPEVPADTQRLFVAIEIPRKLKREFHALAGSFRPKEYERVRWITEDAMHLTLKFLGDIPTDKIIDIKNALNTAAQATGKFSVKIGRTGCFPSFRDPRICWVGFDGELRRLEQLQGRVEGQMVALGLDEDDRKFKAHITVGRTRPGIRGRFAEDIGLSWQHAPLKSTGKQVPVNAIALYRSFINDKGDTEYQQLANYELG